MQSVQCQKTKRKKWVLAQEEKGSRHKMRTICNMMRSLRNPSKPYEILSMTSNQGWSSSSVKEKCLVCSGHGPDSTYEVLRPTCHSSLRGQRHNSLYIFQRMSIFLIAFIAPDCFLIAQQALFAFCLLCSPSFLSGKFSQALFAFCLLFSP